MAVQYSTVVRNAALDAIETAIGVSAILCFYTGAVSANCAASDPAGLAATMPLPSDWMNAASGGTKTLAGTWSVAASGAGTLQSYRIKDSSGTVCHEQGTVGMSGTDIVLDNNVVAVNQVITIQTKVITAGGA